MHFFWSIKLMLFILIESEKGNITPLQCYECSNCEDCSNAPLTSCFSDQDACAIVASWEGGDDYYRPMQISKRCEPFSHCPHDLINGSTTHCQETENGIKCIMCCTKKKCNNGAIGSFLRPPPPPPIPEYKVAHCADSAHGCKTTAAVEGDSTRISKICGKSPTKKGRETPYNINDCNVENKTDICVTCCTQDCYTQSNEPASSSSKRTSHRFGCMLLALLIHSLLILR